MDCRAVSNTFLDIVALLLWSALGRLAAAPITELSFGFDVLRVQDLWFPANHSFSFANVTDIAVNEELGHVFVLQRIEPAVSVWRKTGELLFTWTTGDLGYPHSIKLNGSDPSTATVWVTDMAPPLTAGKTYGHCVKQFSYEGKSLGSIGHCDREGGSGLDPLQFDKVTDIAWDALGKVYISDGDLGGKNNRIVVLDSRLSLLDVWNLDNKPGDKPKQFNLPHRLAVDKCDRIWVTDALNHRVQVIHSSGTYLGEWNCFNTSLIYGIDVSMHSNEMLLVMLTAKTKAGEPQLLVLSTRFDCLQPTLIENCTSALEQQLVLSSMTVKKYTGHENQAAMLHSVILDKTDNSLYLSMLPGSVPPLKYVPADTPPPLSTTDCPQDPHPPKWPSKWNATLLLTPFNMSSLYTGEMVYSDTLKAMSVQVLDNTGLSKEFLTKGSKNFYLERRNATVVCWELKNVNWMFPPSNWLENCSCICQGSTYIADHNLMYWQCPVHDYTEWFWFHEHTNMPWRMFLNNVTNPRRIPVLGNFAMVNFVSYGNNVDGLEERVRVCESSANLLNMDIHELLLSDKFNSRSILAHTSLIPGFTHSCKDISYFPASWPNQFYMTATFLPVNKYNPLPTQVIYDWNARSQLTRMLMSPNLYEAHLIGNHTAILVRHPSGQVDCVGHLDFGMPNPQWMKTDMCKCVGSVASNYQLSSFNSTIIAICPLMNSRVFWTWYSASSEKDFRPILFFETSAPLGEGTDLAFGDYHSFYPDFLLIDQLGFSTPTVCKG
jgi:hypothetical protein